MFRIKIRFRINPWHLSEINLLFGLLLSRLPYQFLMTMADIKLSYLPSYPSRDFRSNIQVQWRFNSRFGITMKDTYARLHRDACNESSPSISIDISMRMCLLYFTDDDKEQSIKHATVSMRSVNFDAPSGTRNQDLIDWFHLFYERT